MGSAPPSLDAGRPLGAAAWVGAACGLALSALQSAGAWAADLWWTLDAPVLSALAPPLAGALGAALLASLAVPLARRVAPTVDALCVALGAAILVVPGARMLASALLRGRVGLPGGRIAALLVTALLWLALGVLAVRALSRARARGRSVRDTTRAAALMGVAATAAVYLVHILLLAIKEDATRRGLLGASAIALLVASGAAGLLLGAAAARRDVLGGASCVALLLGGTFGLLEQRPAEASARAGSHARDAGDASRPNVLLIVLDTLRRDAVSAYGVVAHSTPRLDALAAEGLLVDDALAPGSWTVPSHASLFTAALVSRHGADHARTRLRSRPAGSDDPGLPTLAELFAERGWSTTAFVNNMNVSRANGFDRGFDTYHELWRARQGDFDLFAPALAWLGLGPPLDKGGALCTRGVRAWLADRRDDEAPWLLFVNQMEAHAPYFQGPAQHKGAYLRAGEPSAAVREVIADPLAHVYGVGVDPALCDELWRLYLGGVRYQDALLGEILDALDEHDLARDTLVVVTSDHGENFGWEQRLGHGQDLNDDLVRVPLVLRGPGVPAGARDPHPASLVDVLPTLLALTGGDPLPADVGRPGMVLGGVSGVAPTAERARVLEKLPLFRTSVDEYLRLAPGGDPRWATGRVGIVVGAHSLVLGDGAVGAPPSERLLRRVHDPLPPGDDGTRAVDDADLAARLRAWLTELREQPLRAEEDAEERVPPDEDVLEHLRALGYLGG